MDILLGLLVNILEEGLIYGVMALGVYITYKILDFPDLSVDGTFPLGACVTAVDRVPVCVPDGSSSRVRDRIPERQAENQRSAFGNPGDDGPVQRQSVHHRRQGDCSVLQPADHI